MDGNEEPASTLEMLHGVRLVLRHRAIRQKGEIATMLSLVAIMIHTALLSAFRSSS